MSFIFEISEYIKKSRKESNQSENCLGVKRESHVRKRKSARRKGKAWGFFGKFVYSQPPFIRLISYNPTFRKRKTKL